MSGTVLQSLDRGLLTLTMNRPERRNAINAEMSADLIEAVRRAAEDTAVRAVLLRGANVVWYGDVKTTEIRQSSGSGGKK